MPPGASRRGTESGLFCDTEYTNILYSVEVGMGMEGQIMCVEQGTF